MMPKEQWTDQRLDDLNKKVDDGFARLDGNIRDLRLEVKHQGESLRMEMNARFEKIDARFEKIDERFEALGRALLAAAVAIIVALIGCTASLAGVALL